MDNDNYNHNSNISSGKRAFSLGIMEGSAHSFFLAFIAMFLLLGAPLANQEVREEEKDFRVTTEYLFVVGGFSPDCACYQKTEIIAVTEGVSIPDCLSALSDSPTFLENAAGGALTEAGKIKV